jgi:hypothetical protein
MSKTCSKCGAPTTTLATLVDLPPPNPNIRLTHLLTSNEVPLETEIPFIRDIISEGENREDALTAQMGALEAQIRRLKDTITQLKRKRSETTNYVRQHRAVISSVRCMPPELIAEIFALTLKSSVAWDTDDVMKQPPWRLGQICRSWRYTALSSAPLWSSITVPSAFYPRETDAPRLEAQLLRTANAPLDIYWKDVTKSFESHVVDLVLRHCTRWRSLCLQPGCPLRVVADSVPDWLLPVHGRLQQLQNFQVENAALLTTIPDIFSTAPNLCEVFLTGEKFESSPIIKIPWGQITHYRGTYSPRRQLEILAAAPNLLECAIGLLGLRNFDPGANPVVILPHLRRLRVQTTDLLPNLTAPALQELCGASSMRQAIPLVLPFVHRSSCTLQKLALMQCDICAELITVLQGLPSLIHLILRCRSDARPAHTTLFDAISISDDPCDVCPSLTLFEYGCHLRDQFPVDSFFAMIRSRIQPESSSSCRLLRLRIFDDLRSFNPPPNALMIGIAKLRDEGFDADILEHYEVQLLEKSLL